MRERIRRLKAIVLSVLLAGQLLGADALLALAATVTVTDGAFVQVGTSSADDYDFAGCQNATLQIEAGVTLSGQVYGSGGVNAKVENYGNITGTVNFSGFDATVTNYPTASLEQVTGNNVTVINQGSINQLDNVKSVNNTGTVQTLNVSYNTVSVVNSGDMTSVYMDEQTNAGTTFTMSNGHVDSFNTAGVCAADIYLTGGSVRSMKSYANVFLDGDITINSLECFGTINGTGRAYVSNYLCVGGLHPDITADIEVKGDTRLSFLSGSGITVSYSGKKYEMNYSQPTEGTLAELQGNSISVYTADDSFITELTPLPSDSKYLYGDTTEQAVYIADEGYYFPEDYTSKIVCDGTGILDVQRLDAGTVQLSYKPGADESGKNISVTLPAAAKKTEQAAPQGLLGGIDTIKGTNPTMEYAASADAAEWTTCAGQTTPVSAGIWYVRYKETDSKLAGEPVSVRVKTAGTGSIRVDDFYYGGALLPIAQSDTNGTQNVLIEYKTRGADDASYVITPPQKPGDYTVRATFAENDTYAALVATDDFTISYLPVPDNLYTISGTRGENGYYISSVKITAAAGYLVAFTQDGNYAAFLVADAYTDVENLFFMKQETGEKTAGIKTLAFKIDMEAPTIDAVDNKAYYGKYIEVAVLDRNLSGISVNGMAVDFEDGAARLKLESKGGVTEYEITAVDLAGNEKTVTITVAAEWTKSGIVPNGSAVKLSSKNAYKLGNGTWQVEGDSTSYMGNQTFYVGSEGEYTFNKR